jgi:chaperonin GroES
MATVLTEIPADPSATAYAETMGEEQMQAEQLPLIMQLAQHGGNLTPFLSEQQILMLGADVVEDYERDNTARADWVKIVTDALKSAAQEGEQEAKNYPFQNASDVKYPILTIAATEFWARAYPAIVKGDETVQVKVIGSDKGRPLIGPDRQPVMLLDGNPVPGSAVAQLMSSTALAGQPAPQIEPAWEIPPGAKTARAQRVKEYLNVLLNYRMDDWEGDTSALLYQLPIVGCGFRKLWWDAKKSIPSNRYVPALRLVVPMDAASLETTPRVTEEIPDVYPYQIRQRMFRGEYRMVDLGPSDGENAGDPEAARMLLEQHRLIDLDEDGYEEPYIVTVDKQSREVLSILAAYDPNDIEMNERMGVQIERTSFYVKYDFFPHPEGKFYGIGFGHLLSQISDVINTSINQIIDAGHAQIAGGGFMASGLRLQQNGQTNRLQWRPGEFKFVSVAGGNLRDAIWERTFPNAPPVMFSILELMLGAAKDVAAIKDVLSGESSGANMPVGTVLALIDQGLQVFSAIYKQVYRALKTEFNLDYKLLGRYGDDRTAADYINILDEPLIDFFSDFNAADMNIRPVSDPGSVTRAQKIAKAQFLMETGAGDPNIDQRELKRRVWEAADIEDIDKLMPAPDPNAPPPPEVLKIMSEAARNNADAEYKKAQTLKLGVDTGRELGEAERGEQPEAETRDAA